MFATSLSRPLNLASAGSTARRGPSNGSADNAAQVNIARETTAFARDIGLEPRTTPVTGPCSPMGMAEAFVRTSSKRDYARVNPLARARTVIESLPLWFDHYNAIHPHSALRYRSPREFIAAQRNQEAASVSLGGNKICRGSSLEKALAQRERANTDIDASNGWQHRP